MLAISEVLHMRIEGYVRLPDQENDDACTLALGKIDLPVYLVAILNCNDRVFRKLRNKGVIEIAASSKFRSEDCSVLVGKRLFEACFNDETVLEGFQICAVELRF